MRSYTGFTLLEVLISLLIFSLILLGTDALQIVALRKTRVAYYVQVAEQQLDNIQERLLALEQNEGFTEQISLWNEENKKLLPQGIGTVSGVFPNYLLTLYWGEHSSLDCAQIKIGVSGCLRHTLQIGDFH